MSQFQFVMRSGPTPGVTYPLEGDQITIGRDATNGVAINDAEVSRKHARISFQGGKYVLEDLGSTNGSFVNGQRLSGAAVLKPGDVISFGEQIVLVYEAINIDPGATMVAPARKPARVDSPAPVAAAPRPAMQASAPPAYAPPPPAPAGSAPAKKTNMLPVFIGGGVFLFICMCAGFFWWIDATYRWCVFFPFITGCS